MGMPVFRSGDVIPAWCELTFFEIVAIPAGSLHRFPRREAKEKLLVGRGRCQIEGAGEERDGEEGSNVDLPPDSGGFTVTAGSEPVTVVRMGGRWGDETGGSGLFAVNESAHPADRGDPVSYAKATNFDNHFHDCDEYWIIWEGSGAAVSEGHAYDVRAGDCVATGMGHHHDFPQVSQPVRAVYFETTLEGEKRRGHLWERTHGLAEPRQDRV
jgi:mannose-6-phosphate isomerase-like protein (cupin superfamily)